MTKFYKIFKTFTMILILITGFFALNIINIKTAGAISENIIEIKSEEDFLNMQNSPYIADKSTTFILTRDLNFYLYNYIFNGDSICLAFNGFGNSEKPFRADFNGQGFKITNLIVLNSVFNATEGADIRNFMLYNVTADSNENYERGIIAKYARNTIFENIGIYNYELSPYNNDILLIKSQDNFYRSGSFAYKTVNCSLNNIAVVYNMYGEHSSLYGEFYGYTAEDNESDFIYYADDTQLNNCLNVVSAHVKVTHLDGLSIYSNNKISEFNSELYEKLFSDTKTVGSLPFDIGYETEEIEIIINSEITQTGNNSTEIPPIFRNSETDIIATVILITFAGLCAVLLLAPIIINVIKIVKLKSRKIIN